MTSWVLPGILKAEEVQMTDMEVLVMMSNISTGIVLNYVNKFVDANIGSGDPVLAEAASKLQRAYEEVNKVNDYLNSEEAKNLSETLCSLQYSDVSAELPMEKLIVYRSAILELLSEDAAFLEEYQRDVPDSVTRGFKTAYTPKLDGDNLAATLDGMRVFATGEDAVNRGFDLVLADRIEKNKNLFQNSHAKINAPTVMRKAIYKKDRLKSLLKGIDFLIDKRREGVSPRSWRIV